MEAALFVVAVVAAQGQPEASEQAALAYFKQSGLEYTLDAYQREAFTDEQRRVAGDIALVGRVLVSKQITFTWRFP